MTSAATVMMVAGVAVPRIKLLVRRGERLECLWELDEEACRALCGHSPPDLFVEMKKASAELEPDDVTLDAVFLANRAARYWMDAQGLRERNALRTTATPGGECHDIFDGIRVDVSDALVW